MEHYTLPRTYTWHSTARLEVLVIAEDDSGTHVLGVTGQRFALPAAGRLFIESFCALRRALPVYRHRIVNLRFRQFSRASARTSRAPPFRVPVGARPKKSSSTWQKLL